MPNKFFETGAQHLVMRKILKKQSKMKSHVAKLADVAMKSIWPSIIFNLSNEPAFRFNLCVFGDTGTNIHERTSYLTKTRCIYVETDQERYEIAMNTQKEGADQVNTKYTFSRVKNPLIKDNDFMAST